MTGGVLGTSSKRRQASSAASTSAALLLLCARACCNEVSLACSPTSCAQTRMHHACMAAAGCSKAFVRMPATGYVAAWVGLRQLSTGAHAQCSLQRSRCLQMSGHPWGSLGVSSKRRAQQPGLVAPSPTVPALREPHRLAASCCMLSQEEQQQPLKPRWLGPFLLHSCAHQCFYPGATRVISGVIVTTARKGRHLYNSMLGL